MQVCRRWLYVLGRSDALWRETDLEPHHKAVTDDVLVKLLKTCVLYCIYSIESVAPWEMTSFLVDVIVWLAVVYKETIRGLPFIACRQGQYMHVLGLRNCWRITDAGLDHIAQYAPQITTLSLFSCWDITAAGVRVVAESCPHLKSINLSNCRKITDDAIVQLTNHCIQLTHIELSYCKVCVRMVTCWRD
jgi:hypothetical protein